MPHSSHIVIVGAGHAGGCAAHAIRSGGFQGRLTVIGNENYPPYERPPLSKGLLAGDTPLERTYLKSHDFYAASEITLILGVSVTGIDRKAHRLFVDSGPSLSYDQLLLATGARPRPLSLPEVPSSRILYLRDIKDCLALRSRLTAHSRLIIVGAGFIGLEVAAIARQRHCHVTVLELADYPLSRAVAPEIGAFFTEIHRNHGVNFMFGYSINAIYEQGDNVTVAMDNDTVINGDFILVGIGALPNVEIAQDCGLEVGDGIVVDAFGRTTDPAVFAAGDVAYHFNPLLKRSLRLESWQNAQNQAIAVGKVMIGSESRYAELPWFWSDQYDINFQTIGAPKEWTHLLWRGSADERRFTVFYMANDVPVGGATVNNSREMRFVRELVVAGKPVDPSRLADPANRRFDKGRA